MALTRTWESNLSLKVKLADGKAPSARRLESLWLAAASLLAAFGLLLVLSAKTQDFPELSSKLARGELIDLNLVSNAEQALPLLQPIANPADRQSAAERLAEFVEQHRPLPNVGALARFT